MPNLPHTFACVDNFNFFAAASELSDKKSICGHYIIKNSQVKCDLNEAIANNWWNVRAQHPQWWDIFDSIASYLGLLS